MSDVLFYGISRDKSLAIMVTGITSVVPSNDAKLPLDMQCPKAFFRLREKSVNELLNGEYEKFLITLHHMLIDFFRMAELDR